MMNKKFYGIFIAVICIFLLSGFTFIDGLSYKIQSAIARMTTPPDYEIMVKLKESPDKKITPQILEQTINILDLRLTGLGFQHKIKSIASDKLDIQLFIEDKSKEKNLTNAFLPELSLSFHLVHQDNEKLVQEMNSKNFSPPDGFISVSVYNKEEILFIKAVPEMVDDVIEAKAFVDKVYLSPVIAVRFGAEGTKTFAVITQNNIGRKLAIMLGETIYSAPVIQTSINGGKAIITGLFSIKEAKNLAILLNSGDLTLPVPIEIVKQNFISK